MLSWAKVPSPAWQGGPYLIAALGGSSGEGLDIDVAFPTPWFKSPDLTLCYRASTPMAWAERGTSVKDDEP